MRKIVLIIIIILLSSVLHITVSSKVYADWADISGLIEEEIVKALEDNEAQGAIVSVVKDAEILLCKGFGYANRENSIEADGEHTAFHIGSVSKTFVALAALKLSNGGFIDLNAPVGGYIDDLGKSFSWPFTLVDLLTHSGGFEDMEYRLFTNMPKYHMSLKEYLMETEIKQIYHPGKLNGYSNYGFSLAAYVIQKASGMDFTEYSNKQIFLPLGMKNTSFEQPPEIEAMVSKGYQEGGVAGEYEYINAYPAGSVSSTAQDMSKYMLYMLGEESQPLFKDNIKNRVFDEWLNMGEGFGSKGLAWFMADRNGHRIYMHDGGTMYFSSVLVLYPEDRMGIFVSFNSRTSATYSILEKTTAALYGEIQKSDISSESIYNGNDVKEISGHYVKLRSNFSSFEKLWSLFSDNQIHIIKEGEAKPVLMGYTLYPKGQNLFMDEFGGYYKKYEDDTGEYLVTGADIYKKVLWYEAKPFHIIIPVLFILLTITGMLISFVILIKNNKIKGYEEGQMRKTGLTGLLASIISILLPLFFFLYFFDGYAIGALWLLPALKILSWLVAVAAFILIVRLPLLKKIKRHVLLKLFYLLWAAEMVLMVLWMHNYNVL